MVRIRKMMQLCRNCQDVKYSSVVRIIKRNIYLSVDSRATQLACELHVGAQHEICNMQVSGIVPPLPLGIRIHARNPKIAEVPDAKHVVCEGFLALANEARSDANWLP